MSMQDVVAMCTGGDSTLNIMEILYIKDGEGKSNLFQMSLADDGTKRIIPETNPSKYNSSNGMVMSAISWSVNSIYECANKSQMIKYYHASLGSHPRRTLAVAARVGYFQGCPGLTQEVLNKFITIEDATKMGHRHKTPADVQSNTSAFNRGRTPKEQHACKQEEASTEAVEIPAEKPNNKKTKLVFVTVKLANGFIASDQTGAYPKTSNKGNNCISVFSVYNANHIKGIVLKSNHSSKLPKIYQEMYKEFKSRGFKPILHWMDNETSNEVKEFIHELNTGLQYTTPGCHCAPAEKTVQTYKSCFKSTTALLPAESPINIWYRLLPQIDRSVNKVRPNRQNSKISDWAAMEGEYLFDLTPITLQCTAMLMYNRPENRRSFGHNTRKVWYSGPCFNHYRTFKGILPSTGKERM